MNKEEIKLKAHEVMELGKHHKNLHHKKGFGGLMFIDLSMIKFGRLTRYIRLLEKQNIDLKNNLNKATNYYYKTLAEYEKENKQMPEESVMMFNLMEGNK